MTPLSGMPAEAATLTAMSQVAEKERQFPVLAFHRYPHVPKTVPWEFLLPHEKQAQKNHHQDLEGVIAIMLLERLDAYKMKKVS